MKTIEACLILYNDKDHHTHRNTHRQAGNVDNGIVSVADQASECGFHEVARREIVSNHAYLLYIIEKL